MVIEQLNELEANTQRLSVAVEESAEAKKIKKEQSFETTEYTRKVTECDHKIDTNGNDLSVVTMTHIQT